MGDKGHDLSKISLGMILVSMGIIYGDIGTSPLYVFKAIVGENTITKDIIYGALSCIFWILIIETSFKYVILMLNADNKGEGGIFALYSLVRRRAKWLIVPAMIGGAALLADGMITPPISVASAVEGLRMIQPNIPTVPIVATILTALFLFQRFGTQVVGKSFGIVMTLWFSMLAILGAMSMFQHLEVLNAINPYYAFHFLSAHPQGIFILGAVFLCTTGGEALYSDMGHCGKGNIRVSWIYVKICLLLNYFGQGAWLLTRIDTNINPNLTNPFYEIVPSSFLIPAIIIATLAAIIASQALITGSYTLISEAIKLNLWPKVKVNYPSDIKGQIYVPSVNTILLIGCLSILFYFRESSNMEAAYGLAINITFIMSTILFSYFLMTKKVSKFVVGLFLAVYLSVECTLLIANLAKFMHGGWFTFILCCVFIIVMLGWWRGRKIRNRYVEFVNIDKYLPMLNELSHDKGLPKYATHLAYLTSADSKHQIEEKVMYSIFENKPKRADIYWFIHVENVDSPYTLEYEVVTLVPNDVIKVNFRLGFRVEQKINSYFKKVLEELISKGEINVQLPYVSLNSNRNLGDIKFIVLEKFVSFDHSLPFMDKIVMDIYDLLKKFALTDEKGFGLDSSNVTLEKVPIMAGKVKEYNLKRIS